MPEALRQIKFADIPGWAAEDHKGALEAFQRSAREIIAAGHGFKREALYGGRREDWLPVCAAALTAQDDRSFFEQHFLPLRAKGGDPSSGLFTGYYEPEVRGRLLPDARYNVPIYRKPDDLVAFTPDEARQTGLSYGRRREQAQAYFTREEIEQGALAGAGLEICYLESRVDAFFIHVQGSGRVRLKDGRILRLSYAAKNGQPYTGIGRVLLARGIGTQETMSMQFLRQWLAGNPQEADRLLRSNKSFIFFRENENADAYLGAIGAAKVPLTPLRSLAVDRRYWMFGTPLFIKTTSPLECFDFRSTFLNFDDSGKVQVDLEGASGAEQMQRLMIAQDTGSAIKGLVRGDVYWGWGERAAFSAGHMKSQGSMVALLPQAVVEKLRL